jgi:hypothetical protein
VRRHVKGNGARAPDPCQPRLLRPSIAAPPRFRLDNHHHVDNHPERVSELVSVGESHSQSVHNLTTCRPVLPKDFNANQPKTIRLYPLSNYTFGTKDGQPEEDPSVLARLKRLEEHYNEHGMRRTSEAILVCHEHNHPHILMLQIANAFFKLYVRGIVFALYISDTQQTRRLPPR